MNFYVILPTEAENNDYYSQLYTVNKMREWLTDNNVQFSELRLNYEHVPHTFLMDTQDAVAFKLRFGL
jgi:hypothetical protein